MAKRDNQLDESSENRSENRAEGHSEGLLRQAWPDFLDLLDTDPERGFTEFYDFARKLLAVQPPRVYWQVPELNREDQIHDIMLHCCRNDFRVLKSYQDRGMPFAAWFMLVARNKILDFLRSASNTAKVTLAEEDEENPGVILHDPTPLADRQTDRQKIIALVQDLLQKMNDKCRVLIQGAAEGYKPRELTQLLGWPVAWNKKASDDLRECRKKLISLLGQHGLDPGELNEHFG